MKKDIHPKYYQATVTCTTCGTTFTVGSTKKSISVDTCSHCHSFYTGKINLNSKTGRIDRFNRKAAAAAPKAEDKPAESK